MQYFQSDLFSSNRASSASAKADPTRGTFIRHGCSRVRSFRIEWAYTVRVAFDDGTEQVINFEPILFGELYRPLRDVQVFNQVKIDPEVHTLVWPNGADFDPETLHDWPTYADALAARARSWELVST